MRRRSSAKLLAADVIVGVGVSVCVVAGWSMSLREEPASAAEPALTTAEPALSAADTVALRFPYQEEADQPAALPGDDTASEPDETFALFNPNPTYPTAAPSDLEGAPPSAAPEAVPSAPVERDASKFAAVPTHRSSVRPGAVLSEAQIQSIKRRLKLTPDQQHMWPAVEVALRSLTYPKKSDVAHRNDGAVDSNSSEVKELTSAAYPLVMSFSDEQKRELHVLAHVAGLEQLVPKF